MEPIKLPPVNAGGDQQRKPTSVFRAMLPRNPKPNHTGGSSASPTKLTGMRPPALRSTTMLPVLAQDHPYADLPLGEVNQNRERTRSSPAYPQDLYFNGKGKSTGEQENRQPCGNAHGSALNSKDISSKADTGLKKSKSSTNFAAFLTRPKSSKNLKLDTQRQQKDKENRTPPSSADGNAPPIWTQFASAQNLDLGIGQKVPLNDRRNVHDEAVLYTPIEYSPSKGRNFHDDQPTLSSKATAKGRPTSAYLPSSKSSTSFSETISGLRKLSRKPNKEPPTIPQGQDDDLFSCRQPSTELRKISNDSSQAGLTLTKRGSRVMAAVAKLNGTIKEPTGESTTAQMDPEVVERAFEALLVRGQIIRIMKSHTDLDRNLGTPNQTFAKK